MNAKEHAVESTFTLTLWCPERPGIVHAVTSFLLERGSDIVEHQQFDDHLSGSFFLRTSFTCSRPETSLDDLTRDFSVIARDFAMEFQLSDDRQRRLLIMVSKFGHCLNDLLFRWRAGSLGADIAVVVSNHQDLRPMVEAAGLPFVHIPVTPETKPEAESHLLRLVDEHQVDLVVLARYMQVLSNDLCMKLEGRAINIHHSLLPGFKGAKPYHQAYTRGVKYVGATAHYVTPDLDEGPIIEQEVLRVDHAQGPQDLVTIGRDAEALALSRAVRWHCEHRVMLNDNRTIVFR